MMLSAEGHLLDLLSYSFSAGSVFTQSSPVKATRNVCWPSESGRRKRTSEYGSK